MKGAWEEIANFSLVTKIPVTKEGHICSSYSWFLGILTGDPERTS